MKKIALSMLVIILGLNAQTSLFQVTDQIGKKVLDVTSNGLIILNPNSTTDTYDDTLMIITNTQIKTFVDGTANKGLARSVSVVSTASGKATQSSLMSLRPENYFIGHQSGAVTTGTKNTFFGYLTGKVNTTGASNIFIGNESGQANVAGLRNVFIGNQAGYSNVGNATSSTIGHDNIYIGSFAGKSNQVGEHNTMIGSYNGYNAASGNRNTFIGAFNGFNATGANNTTLGVDAGRNLSTGSENTYLGAGAASNEGATGPGVGSRNTFIGYCSGFSNKGDDNVFLGYRAGQTETGSDKLYIANTATATPLIKGTFPNVDLDITATYISLVGNVEIGTGTPSSNRLKVTNSQSGISGATGYFESTNSAGIGLATFANSTDVALYAEQKNSSSTTANIAKFASAYGGWSEKMTIRSSGRIYTPDLASGTGTALQLTTGGEIVKFSSSKKYKKDIKSLSPDVSKFMELNPVSFTWNEKSATENKSDYGLIAEEVEKIDKSLAVYNKDNSIEGVDYHKVNIMLLKVVQEQQKKIDDLEKRLNKLENK